MGFVGFVFHQQTDPDIPDTDKGFIGITGSHSKVSGISE